MSDETLPAFVSLNVGDEVAAREVEFTRGKLVRYAGASGDFNPIHFNDAFAQSGGSRRRHRPRHAHDGRGRVRGRGVGWRGKRRRLPGALHEADRRRCASREWWCVSTAVVGALDHDVKQARIDVSVTVDGAKVLGKAQALVDCA